MSQPANHFENLAGVPVLYDRLKPEHYGKTGIPYQFYCTQTTETTLENMFRDLFSRTVPRFGPVSFILSAGAWVAKPGQHGAGKAFDLDAIHWQRVKLVALDQPRQKPLYLAVQALCNKYFGVVLGYDYNADHHDHLHIDISRPVQFREANSVVSFVQQALTTLYNRPIEVDGEWGDQTERALRDTLAVLGIPNVQTVDRWKRFLDAVCDEAISRVAAGIDADAALAPEGVAAANAAHDQAEHGFAAPAEGTLEAPLAIRPDTGRIDLNYKPFPTWAVYPRTVSGTERWYVDFDTTSRFYMGTEFALPDTPYVGLARTGASSTPDIPYDHEAYRASFGHWASFVHPTGRCESEARFLVINAWDAAAMTFGFFQMAAHTGEHLANLFRELIDALPDEANQFYPEIKLGKQIGHSDQMRLFAVNGTDKLDLDAESRPADGLPYSSWYRGRFMGFFNPHRGRLEIEEVVAAARWVAWLKTSSRARDVCVRNAVNGAKKAVKRVHTFVKSQHHAKYPNGLDGVSMALVAAAMDVKHHGRRNAGQSADQSIFAALIAGDPFAKFEVIDTGWRRKRSKRSVAEIRAMSQWFDGKVYDAAAEDFR